MRITGLPAETHPVLIIDPDAVLSLPITSQALQAVAGWYREFPNIPHPVDLRQLSPRNRPHRGGTGHPSRAGVRAVEDVLSPTIGKGAYHGSHYNGQRIVPIPVRSAPQATARPSPWAVVESRWVGQARRLVEFRPGDTARYALDRQYHVPNRPFFDEVELKGGGDAASAARAVLQTGEFDFAWNVQVEDDVLRRLEPGGRGRVEIVSSDPGNADTVARFAADLQMFTVQMGSPDPQAFMEQFCSWEIAAKANHWSRNNYTRWRSEEYDRLWKAAEREMDPIVRAAHFIKLNDLVIQQVVVIPIIWRNLAQAVGARLRGVEISGWDSNLSRLAYWYREG